MYEEKYFKGILWLCYIQQLVYSFFTIIYIGFNVFYFRIF